MSKREEFNTALKTAMKEKNQIALSTVRLILSALKDRDVAERTKGNNNGMSENEILSMLQTMIKQRAESIETYSKAGRKDLADKEQAEIEVIQGFLPESLSEAETEALIDKLMNEHKVESMRDMGKVMGVIKADYAGRVDMGLASGMVKKKLS